MLTLMDYYNVRMIAEAKRDTDIIYKTLYESSDMLCIEDMIRLIMDYEIIILKNKFNNTINTRFNVIEYLTNVVDIVDDFVGNVTNGVYLMDHTTKGAVLLGLYDTLFCNGSLFTNTKDLLDSIVLSIEMWVGIESDYRAYEDPDWEKRRPPIILEGAMIDYSDIRPTVYNELEAILSKLYSESISKSYTMLPLTSCTVIDRINDIDTEITEALEYIYY